MLGIDTAVIAVVCCTLLCGVVFVLSPLLQVVEIVIQIFSTIFDLVFGLVGSGPEGCVGCFALLFGCILCSGLGWVIIDSLQTCGTPDAVNFCQLFD